MRLVFSVIMLTLAKYGGTDDLFSRKSDSAIPNKEIALTFTCLRRLPALYWQGHSSHVLWVVNVT